MIDAARINVKSNDRPGGVDAKGGGTLEHDCTCARSIERSDDTVTSAHVTEWKKGWKLPNAPTA